MEVKRRGTKWIAGFTVVSLLACFIQVKSQNVYELANVIFVTRAGFHNTRIHCTEILHCTGEGEEVFWSLFGQGSTPLMDTDARFVNTTTMMVGNSTVITAKLIFAPVTLEDNTFYICQVKEDGNLVSINIRLIVDSDPIEIVTSIENIDISNNTIGDTIPIVCQLETCLSDAIVSIYKGDEVVFTSQATESFVNSVTFVYNHEVTANSAGQYACRGFTSQGSTPLHYFNITGTPNSPPMSLTSVGGTPPSSSNAVNPSITSPAMVGTATPTPTSMPGGSMGLMAQWTTVLSLLVVTTVTMVLV